MRLKDKVAIVTGAAWGMGASTAELFAAEGACVMVTDVLDAEGTDVVARISDSGGQAQFRTLDVTNDTGWASVVSETISTFGQIDILVNNAGVSGSHPDLLNTQTWDEQMNVNARGVFLGMQAVIPQMQKAGVGCDREHLLYLRDYRARVLCIWVTTLLKALYGWLLKRQQSSSPLMGFESTRYTRVLCLLCELRR